MATVTVRLPAALVYPSENADLEGHGATVGEVVEDCCARRPGLAERIFSADGDEIHLTPPIAGG